TETTAGEAATEITAADAAAGDESSTQPPTGIRLVSAEQGAEIHADPPDGLIVLDVRTPDEFAQGHVEGATMIDFYAPDFEERLAELDRERPYLLYCRSGSRSGQTTAIMEQLGFSNVADIDGGITAWTEAGLPVTN
ncbi:MAG: rhodanese-like domain-containing protein, partial [Acidimicrobiales bacterium]